LQYDLINYFSLSEPKITSNNMNYEFTEEFAEKQDAADPLKKYRDEFHFPEHKGEKKLYFTGNSLGLQPKNVEKHVKQEIEDWAKYGVDGHFEAGNPWYSYHELFSEPLSKIVGAKPHEVVAMNSLTVNLHLLMVSFYKPDNKRYKILCEAKAFPSDQYALASQVKHHGLKPEETLIELSPREGEHIIRTGDVLETIEKHKDELALIMIGGVNYYTGQLWDMKTITKAGHNAGALVGWDLAHGAGNVNLKLHDWDVDFATWCSYKYMNSGPGGVSGIYVHEKHAENKALNRFAGWWGHNKEERFKMEKDFDPIPTAEGWQLSNAAVFSMAPHKASLELFSAVGMSALTKKSEKLTGYLEFVLEKVSRQQDGASFEIITPRNSKERGCQLSVLVHGEAKKMFDYLTKEGVVVDYREPNVIRMAPVPLYNNFMDVYRFGKILRAAIDH